MVSIGSNLVTEVSAKLDEKIGFEDQNTLVADEATLKQLSTLGSNINIVDLEENARLVVQSDFKVRVFDNPSADLFYYRNNQVTTGALSILRNDDGNNRELKYPDVLSHEIIKSIYQPSYKTNEFSILPADIHSLKKDYVDDIHNPNANRFFLSTKLQKNHRETYYNNLKNNNLVVKETYEDFFNVLNKKVFYQKKYNFGNKISGFYLNSVGSFVIGKLANTILDNNNINFNNNHSNMSFFNKNIDELIIKDDTLDFDYFKDEEKKKIFSIMFSSYTDNNKLYKDCNENNFIVNTDKLINQVLLNSSVSMNGIYKDCLYDLGSFTGFNSNVEEFKETLKVVDSVAFDLLPILKNESILNKIENSIFFNPYTYENIGTFNKDAFRELKIENLNPDSYMKKDRHNRVSSINNKVGEVFDKSLFLSNQFSVYIKYIRDRYYGYVDDEFNEKQDNLPLLNDDDYKNYFLNHSLVPEVRINEFGIDEDNSAYTELSYMSDIGYFSYNTALQGARDILNNSKFIYNFKRTSEDLSGYYNSKRITNIVTENALYARSRDTQNEAIRYPLPTFLINFNQWKFRERTDQMLNENILTYKIYRNLYSNNSINLKDTLNKYINTVIDTPEIGLHEKIDVLRRNDSETGVNDYDFENSKGFILFKNSMNNISKNQLYEKFVLYKDNLTEQSELSHSRIILSSSKNDIGKNRYVETAIDDVKTTSFEDYGYSWQELCLDLSNNMFELKKRSLENNNVTNYLKYMLEYKEKAKSAKESHPDFSLAYSDINVGTIDKKVSSDFLTSLSEDNFVQKFNFSESYGNVFNSIEAVNNQIIDEIVADFTSEDVKEYASLMYSDCIFKTEKVYFDFIKKQTTDIINNITEDLTTMGVDNTCYDKLLSDVVINKSDSFIFEILASSAILDYKNLLEDRPVYDKINNSTEGSYKDFLDEIYSVASIRRQKSYNLRTYEYPKGNMSKIFTSQPSDWNSNEPEKNTAKLSYGVNDYIFKPKDHVLDCGVLPGNTYNFCFPFITRKYKYKSNETKDHHCSIYEDDGGDYWLVDKKKFDRVNESHDSNVSDLYEFYFSRFYNNDVYLNIDKGINVAWSNDNDKGWPICEIYNVIKDNNSVNFKSAVENLTYSIEDANEGNIELFYTDPTMTSDVARDLSLGYSSDSGIEIIDYTFIKSGSRLKSVINRIIMDCFFQFSKDFDVEIASLNTTESIYKFVKDNNSMSRSVLGLIKPLCLMYTTFFDAIVDLSIRKFIYPSLSNDQDEFAFSSINSATNVMWNNEVVDLILKPEDIFKQIDDIAPNNYKFSNDVYDEDSSYSIDQLYLKVHAEIGLIDKTLSNSSILKIMSLDTIFSYFNEFERFKNEASLDAGVVGRSLERIEDNLNVENPNELLSNKSRINLISKNLNDYYFYQTVEYEKYYGIQRNVNTSLKQKFDNVINEKKMFSTHLKRDEMLAELAKQSSEIVNGNYKQYDVIRFGIDFEMAEVLRDRRLLKFKINLFNHKFPNIAVPSMFKFYTPVFTEITPSHFNLMEDIRRLNDTSYSKRVEHNLGFYNYNEDSLKDRYRILSSSEGIYYVMHKLINNVNNKRMFYSEADLIDTSPASKVLLSKSIVASAIVSNMAKHMSYINQKKINEINIGSLDISNLNRLSNVASGFLDSLNKESFEQIFLESYDELIETFNEEETIDYDKLFENKVYSLDFLNKTSDYIDLSKIESIFSSKKFYDVFSILISRKDIKSLLERHYVGNDRILRAIANENFFDSFSYVIQAEIV